MYNRIIRRVVKVEEEYLSLQQILKRIDEFTGYEANQENSKDHVIRETTWRKYVRLYNKCHNEESAVIKIGNTRGTKYKLEDVKKVIKWSRTRIESNWFDKTLEGAPISQYYVQGRKEIEKQDFMKLISEKRKESKELSEMPISKVAKIIGEERVPPGSFEKNLFGEENQETKLTSKEIKKIDREEELRFLSSFNIEAYETNASNHARLLEEEFDEFTPSGKSASGTYTEFGVFHPELFLKKECINTILWAVENDFWDKIKEESSI